MSHVWMGLDKRAWDHSVALVGCLDEWVMSCMGMSHVTFVNEACHTCERVSIMGLGVIL